MTIAQSEESCVVYGMPKAAIDRGYASRVVDLEAMASTLMALCAETGRGDGQSGNGAAESRGRRAKLGLSSRRKRRMVRR